MWRFDTTAGREEILARRIGKNELDAIQTSLPMLMRRMNTQKKIVPALASKHMRNASSASLERKTGSIGRLPKVTSPALWVSSSQGRLHKATGLEASGRPSTATISRS